MGIYTTQAKYLHNKLRINFSMSPSFIKSNQNVFAYMQVVYCRHYCKHKDVHLRRSYMYIQLHMYLTGTEKALNWSGQM